MNIITTSKRPLTTANMGDIDSSITPGHKGDADDKDKLLRRLVILVVRQTLLETNKPPTQTKDTLLIWRGE